MFINGERLGRVRASVAFLLVAVLTSFYANLTHAQVANDPVDGKRAVRYIERLKKLQVARVAMRDRASSLMAQTPNLELELQQALSNSLVTAGALQFTPEIRVTPSLLQGYRTYRGQNGEFLLRPELLLWYTFQDNTLVRQQLFLAMANSQRSAAQSFSVMYGNRLAVEQVANNADQNFLEFRHLGDVMGRRSPLELAEAEVLAGGWLQDEPLHAGAALVRAHALRSMARYDESNRLLDQLDNNFPAMQSIRESVEGQIAFLGGDVNVAKQHLEKGIAMARDSGTGEPHLIYGWLFLAEQKWAQAKNSAARLRQLSPDDVESAILEAYAIAFERPARARDALQILRKAQLNSSPDDWHYHEALAIVHMIARDRQFANREITEALTHAPSHVRPELEREQVDIQAGNVPVIDWAARLRMQWRSLK